MKTVKSVLPALLLLLWGLCAIDGVCVALEKTFLGIGGGNVASGLFFALVAVNLGVFAGNRKALRRLFAWSVAALLGLVALLLALWGLLALGAPAGVRNACVALMSTVIAPVTSCSVMFLPIFGWACVLIGSRMLLRRSGNQSRRL